MNGQTGPQLSPNTAWEEPAPNGSKHALEYLRVLYKRRILAVTAFVIVVAVMTQHTFALVPIYQASARLLLYFERTKLVNYEAFVEDWNPDNQTPYLMLQSRALAKKALETLKTSRPSGPEATAASGASLSTFAQRLSGSVRTWFARTEASSEPGCLKSVDKAGHQTAAVDCLLRGLSITEVPKSNLVDISFRSSDPVAAAAYANALAAAYVEENLHVISLATREAMDWMSKEVEDQRQRMEGSEQALQQHRERNKIVGPDEPGNAVIQKLGDVTAALVRAKTDRMEKEAASNRIAAADKNVSLLAEIPQIQQAQSIQQLRAEMAEARTKHAGLVEVLGEKHPDLIKARSTLEALASRLRIEIVQAADSLTTQFHAAQALEARLTDSFTAQKQAALQLKGNGGEMAVLESNAASDRQIYVYLMQREKEARIAAKARTGSARIVDRAETPLNPMSRNVRSNLSYALMSGLFVAIGLVFLFEYFDDRMKNPDEIENQLGLRNLGMVPQVLLTKGERPLGRHGPRFIEAFGSIRTNVQYASAPEGCRSIVITSSGPKEGKTTMAVNLATSLAQTGGRVLLFDADLRRPDVHRRLNIPQGPGLSNLLVGTAKQQEVVQRVTPSLSVIPSGIIPPNPAELLGSKRFRDLLQQLGQTYDWIVLDTPPVMAVSDAVILAGMVSGVLFVVAADKTNRQVARLSVKRLETTNCTFLGAVLNQVNIERHPYYYARYYHRKYDGYYARARA